MSASKLEQYTPSDHRDSQSPDIADDAYLMFFEDEVEQEPSSESLSSHEEISDAFEDLWSRLASVSPLSVTERGHNEAFGLDDWERLTDSAGDGAERASSYRSKLKEQLRTRFVDLLTMSYGRGYVLRRDLLELTLELYSSSERHQPIVDIVRDVGIEVLDDHPEADVSLSATLATYVEPGAWDEIAAVLCDPDVGSIDDPYRYYYQDVGRLRLLSKDEERQLAQKMVNCRARFVTALVQCTPALRACAILLEKVIKKEVGLREIFETSFDNQLYYEDDRLDEPESEKQNEGIEPDNAETNPSSLLKLLLSSCTALVELSVRATKTMPSDENAAARNLAMQLIAARLSIQAMEKIADSVKAILGPACIFEMNVYHICVSQCGMPGERFESIAKGRSVAEWYEEELAERFPWCSLLRAQRDRIFAEQLNLYAVEKRIGSSLGVFKEQCQDLSDALSEYLKLRSAMVEANVRLVMSIARRYLGYGLPFLDLVQEGNIGLLKAIERFDAARESRFSTYATWWIKQSIARYIANHSRTIRLPVHVSEAIGRIIRARSQLQLKCGQTPSFEQIGASAGVDMERVRKLLCLSALIDTISFEDIKSEDNDEEINSPLGFEEKLAFDPFEIVAHIELERIVALDLESFSERDAAVLRLRYGFDDEDEHTLEQIGQFMGVTRERIRQIESKLLTRFRHSTRLEKYQPYRTM